MTRTNYLNYSFTDYVVSKRMIACESFNLSSDFLVRKWIYIYIYTLIYEQDNKSYIKTSFVKNFAFDGKK